MKFSSEICKDDTHFNNWEDAIKRSGAVYDDGVLKGDYAASLYLIAGATDIYDRAKRFIFDGWIDFVSIKRLVLSSSEMILVSVAANLYNGMIIDVSPLDIVSACDTDMLLIVSMALLIRKNEVVYSEGVKS